MQPPVSMTLVLATTAANFATSNPGVVDTSDKFATGGKFAVGAETAVAKKRPILDS